MTYNYWSISWGQIYCININKTIITSHPHCPGRSYNCPFYPSRFPMLWRCWNKYARTERSNWLAYQKMPSMKNWMWRMIQSHLFLIVFIKQKLQTFSEMFSFNYSKFEHLWNNECLVGNVIDMSTTCLQQAQMLENSKNNSSVVDMEFFHLQVMCQRPVMVTNCDWEIDPRMINTYKKVSSEDICRINMSKLISL